MNREAAKVYVIDDTPANLRLLDSMLRQKGYRTYCFPGGLPALRAARKNPPDLVLVDINMPEMDGYEVCDRFKRIPGLKEIPVIFISALNQVEDKVRAFNAGGVDYVTKPFKAEEVEARVETHLKIIQLQRDLIGSNEQLQCSLEELKRLESLHDSLVHMLAHDMRTPLAAIRLGLDLIKMRFRDRLTAEDEELINGLLPQCHSMVAMLNDLLDVSRLEQGSFPLNMETGKVDAIVSQSLDSLGVLSQRVHHRAGQPIQVACDPQVAARVLTKLLSSALKQSPHGGRASKSRPKPLRPAPASA